MTATASPAKTRYTVPRDTIEARAPAVRDPETMPRAKLRVRQPDDVRHELDAPRQDHPQ